MFISATTLLKNHTPEGKIKLLGIMPFAQNVTPTHCHYKLCNEILFKGSTPLRLEILNATSASEVFEGFT